MNDPPDQTAEFRAANFVVGRDDGSEVLLDQVRVLAHCGVGVHEEDTQLLQVLPVAVIDHLGVVDQHSLGDEVVMAIDFDVEHGGNIGRLDRNDFGPPDPTGATAQPGQLGQLGDVAGKGTGQAGGAGRVEAAA
jgi:hypothetical protein